MKVFVHGLSVSRPVKIGKPHSLPTQDEPSTKAQGDSKPAWKNSPFQASRYSDLFQSVSPPIKARGESPIMQITVTVSDEIVREAGDRGLPVIDFVESLIDRGLSLAKERPVLSSAMERIRALRSTSLEGRK
jgi:hypothetical protein